MSTITELNPRLLALTEAGVSVWLDQIRRSMIEGGELARMVVGGVAARRDVESVDLREGDPRLDRLRRGPPGARPGGPRFDGDLRADRDPRRAARGRRAGRGASQLGRSRRVRVPGGGARSWPTTPRARSSRCARSGSGSTAQRDDQDPRDRRGRAGDRAGDVRGHQRQRHAAVLGRGVRAGGRGVLQRARAPAEARACRWTSTPSRASSSRASTRRSTGSLEQLGRTDLAGTAALANARAAYRRFQEIFSGGSVGGAAPRPARPSQRPLWASTGTKNPHYSDTMYVDGLVGAHTVNTMPLPTLLAFADHGKVTGPTAEHDPCARSGGAGRGRDRPGRGHRRAARRRGQAVRGRDEPAAGGHRGTPRGGGDRAAAAGSRPGSRRCSRRRSPSACSARWPTTSRSACGGAT